MLTVCGLVITTYLPLALAPLEGSDLTPLLLGIFLIGLFGVGWGAIAAFVIAPRILGFVAPIAALGAIAGSMWGLQLVEHVSDSRVEGIIMCSFLATWVGLYVDLFVSRKR